MKITYDYEVTYNQPGIIDTLGLKERGTVQKFIANQVLMLSTPYVPFDQGTLRDSGHLEGTDVVWKTPYARRMYYHPEYNFQHAPLKGAFWVDRAMKNGGFDKITKGAQAIVNRLAKNV